MNRVEIFKNCILDYFKMFTLRSMPTEQQKLIKFGIFFRLSCCTCLPCFVKIRHCIRKISYYGSHSKIYQPISPHLVQWISAELFGVSVSLFWWCLEVQLSNGLMMWVELISGGGCFRLIRSYKKKLWLLGMIWRVWRVFVCFVGLCCVCCAFEGMSVALLRELDCVFLKNKNMERKSWRKCFPLFFWVFISFHCLLSVQRANLLSCVFWLFLSLGNFDFDGSHYLFCICIFCLDQIWCIKHINKHTIY